MRRVRRIKAKAKKIKTKKTVLRKRASVRSRLKPPVPPAAKEGVLTSEEVAIEREKFSPAAAGLAAPRAFQEDLPQRYGRDTLVLQVRDPRWLHSYWELGDAASHHDRLILRVYDVSLIIFNGNNAHSFFDVDIAGPLGNWYIQVAPGKSWCAELGFKLTDGAFIKLLRSNTVHTPHEGPSSVTDEEWMVAESDFARLYGMGFGFGKSSPVGKNWQKRLKKMLVSRDVSSRRISA